MSDKDDLMAALIVDGYAVREHGSSVEAYFDDSHEYCDLFSRGQEYGHIITGVQPVDSDRFVGYVRYAPAHAVDIAGVNIEIEEDDD